MTPAQTEARAALERYRRAIERRCALQVGGRGDLRKHDELVKAMTVEQQERRNLETAFDLALHAMNGSCPSESPEAHAACGRPAGHDPPHISPSGVEWRT